MSKKILFSSNWSKMKTGFGRNTKEVLTRLYKAGYEIVEYAAGGIRDGSPESKAAPWKIRGVIPANDADFQHIANNPHMLNEMAHGAMLIDRVLKEEKPDVCIFVEDIWNLQWAFNKPWWNKLPCIVWTPIDSEPMLPVFKDNKSKFKNLWVKADFAKRALKELDIDSEIVPCLIDQSVFRPLSSEEKLNLRKTFRLEDSFIVGFVFRNQLRKLILTLMRAFKAFQVKYPESKAKLLLHTNFGEPGGWNIPIAAQQMGIDMSDILTTYVCKKCKKAQIIQFHGLEINCGACKTEKSLVNVDINCGVTESELNCIYNMMDCYAHPATSGGHEVPLEEAMLAGVPCGTVNYAFGETYVSSGEVFSFEHHFYDERESGFRKSQPTDESVFSFLEKTYLNKEESKSIGLKGREWALNKFSPDKHCDFIIKTIESFGEHNYDFNFYDQKDVDFPPDYSLSSNVDFLINLYSGIFGVETDSNNPDVQKYSKELEYKTREEVVKEIKQIAYEHNQRQKSISVSDFIIPSDKKKLIYVMPSPLIECFNSLSVIEGLKSKYPLDEWDYYISCKTEYRHVFEHLDYIKSIIPYIPAFDQPFSLEGHGEWNGFFDIAFQPHLNPRNIHNGLDV